MSQIYVAVSSTVDAPPETVYAVLADYREQHPQILPKPYFAGIEVEAGGYGAGTRLRVQMQVLGNHQEMSLHVSEPEPGRVLAETDVKTGTVTAFTVLPWRESQSEVTITTTLARQPGVRGFIEGVVTPPLLRRIYHQELHLLEQHFQRQGMKR